MDNVKKLINFAVPEFEDELKAVEERNKNNKGSQFVCKAIRFYLMYKDKGVNEVSEAKVREIAREIAQEEVKKVLKNYKLSQKEEEKEEHKKINAFEILGGEHFQQNFEKFESDNS